MSRRNPATDLKPYFLVEDDIVRDYGGKLAWEKFFGNDHPVELDIGSGRGLFLVRAGSEHPERNYLGIEIDYKEGRRGAARIRKREWPHVRVLGGDALRICSRYIAPHSVAAVHVYFPDPWWKKKHHKRRIFTDRFVDLCAELLEGGGLLHSWTDVPEYFELIQALMDHHPDFVALPPPEENKPQHGMDYQTSFERKKRLLGLPIFRGRWQRKPVAREAEEGE